MFFSLNSEGHFDYQTHSGTVTRSFFEISAQIDLRGTTSVAFNKTEQPKAKCLKVQSSGLTAVFIFVYFFHQPKSPHVHRCLGIAFSEVSHNMKYFGNRMKNTVLKLTTGVARKRMLKSYRRRISRESFCWEGEVSRVRRMMFPQARHREM